MSAALADHYCSGRLAHRSLGARLEASIHMHMASISRQVAADLCLLTLQPCKQASSTYATRSDRIRAPPLLHCSRRTRAPRCRPGPPTPASRSPAGMPLQLLPSDGASARPGTLHAEHGRHARCHPSRRSPGFCHRAGCQCLQRLPLVLCMIYVAPAHQWPHSCAARKGWQQRRLPRCQQWACAVSDLQRNTSVVRNEMETLQLTSQKAS